MAVAREENRGKGDLSCSSLADEAVAAAMATTRMSSGERGREP